MQINSNSPSGIMLDTNHDGRLHELRNAKLKEQVVALDNSAWDFEGQIDKEPARARMCRKMRHRQNRTGIYRLINLTTFKYNQKPRKFVLISYNLTPP